MRGRSRLFQIRRNQSPAENNEIGQNLPRGMSQTTHQHGGSRCHWMRFHLANARHINSRAIYIMTSVQ